jgi:hypothetical protein
MNKQPRKNPGVILLISRYRKMFRVPENLNYYSTEDFDLAERKFIKMAVKTGRYQSVSKVQPPAPKQ